MSFIEREPLLAAYDAAHQGPPGGARKLIEEAPAVEVVPLDRLCEYLALSQSPAPHCRYCPRKSTPCNCHCILVAEEWKTYLRAWMREEINGKID